MTLLELITALALLSTLGIGAAAWIDTAAGAQRAIAPQLRWREAAEATLDVIADDVAIGDFGSTVSGPLVSVAGEGAVIRTRGEGGPAQHEYRLNGRELQLTRTHATSVLMSDVAALDVVLAEETDLLHVTIHGFDENHAERWIRIR